MESMFTSINQVSELDKIFTHIVKKLNKTMESEFVRYTDEFGITTNAFDEFILYSIDDIIVEYDNGYLEVFYKFSDNNVAKLISFFINYDMVCMNKKNTKCSISNSNNPQLAKTLNKLLTL